MEKNVNCCEYTLVLAREYPCIAVAVVIGTAGLPIIGYLGYRAVKLIVEGASYLIGKIHECFQRNKEEAKPQSTLKIQGSTEGSAENLDEAQLAIASYSKTVRVKYISKERLNFSVQDTLKEQLLQRGIKVHTVLENEVADITVLLQSQPERVEVGEWEEKLKSSILRNASEVALVFLSLSTDRSSRAKGNRLIFPSQLFSHHYVIGDRHGPHMRSTWNLEEIGKLVDRIANTATTVTCIKN